MPVDLKYLEDLEKLAVEKGVQLLPKKNHYQQYNRHWIVMKDGVSITEPYKQRAMALQEMERLSMENSGARLTTTKFLYYVRKQCSACKFEGTFEKLVGETLIYKCANGHITKIAKQV